VPEHKALIFRRYFSQKGSSSVNLSSSSPRFEDDTRKELILSKIKKNKKKGMTVCLSDINTEEYKGHSQRIKRDAQAAESHRNYIE
jgi:hypothetical protein